MTRIPRPMPGPASTIFLSAMFLALCLAPMAWADTSKDTDLEAIIEAVRPSLVRVEYAPRFDKGQAPDHHLAELIRDERRFEVAGYLIAPDRVILPDWRIHPRFVESIEVVFGDQRVTAKPTAWALRYDAVILALEQPLTGARPLTFDASLEGPFFNVDHGRSGHLWAIGVTSAPNIITKDETGTSRNRSGGFGVVVDAEGRPVGMSLAQLLPADGSWKGSPMSWELVTAQQRDDALGKLGDEQSALMTATLRFRTRQRPGERMRWSDSDDDATERHTVAVPFAENHVLLPLALNPDVTARLEQITLHPMGQEPIEAEFVCSLKDYGAIIAKTAKPLERHLGLAETPIVDRDFEMVMVTDFRVQGETAEVYHNHDRVIRFRLGWRNRVFPMLEGDDSNFVFDFDGRLVAFPLTRRDPTTAQDRWQRERTILTPIEHLTAIFADPQSGADPDNIPLSEEDENRVAWLGVEMQSLTRELARAQNVSELTRDGSTGGMITHVYKDSPADRLGLRPGMILLRLHAAGLPRPMEISVDPDPMGGQPWPWQHYDEIPVEAFDGAPTPWRSRHNALTRALTTLGVDREIELELHAEGETRRIAFQSEWSPRHYDSARRLRSEPLGMTVRELSYEVKRYFRRDADDPGLIVSRVEPGSRAAVAGIRPYELITSVNEQPVNSVEQFEQAIAGQDEIRLGVLRMTRNFVRKINMGAQGGRNDDAPSEESAPTEN